MCFPLLIKTLHIFWANGFSFWIVFLSFGLWWIQPFQIFPKRFGYNAGKLAHFTSAKFSEDESEFHHCNFDEEYIKGFNAPFVKESKVKIGMQLVEEKHIDANDTILIVGEVKNIIIDNKSLEEDGSVNLGRDETVCISGLDTYYETNKISKYPYARKDNLPF